MWGLWGLGEVVGREGRGGVSEIRWLGGWDGKGREGKEKDREIGG